MAMSKKSKIVILILLGIYIIPFFIYKYIRLGEYNIYTGKVVDLTEITVTENYKGSRRHYTRTIPVIEYRTKNDTSVFEERRRFMIGFNIGESVTVLEKKDNPYKAMVLSFWIYWVRFYELLTFLLVVCGFYIVFIAKKKS